MSDIETRLRDSQERFLFQGGSPFALNMADEFQRLRDEVAALKAENDTLRDSTGQDEFMNPCRVVMFRAGLLVCREYIARFIEAESPSIARSIRANWWPNLGPDPGPPRQNNWDEFWEGGEYPKGRAVTTQDASIEALGHAWLFLEAIKAGRMFDAQKVNE